MTELTQEIVREFLDYDPDTGKLYWKERDAKWFKDGYRTSQGNANAWNVKFAGKEAFTSLTTYGHKQGQIFNSLYRAHQIIWLWMTGEWPEEIDHEDGVGSNNSFSNLKQKCHSENMKNLALRCDNTSGVHGVTWYKPGNKWRVRIKNEKEIHLGYFLSFEEAVEVRKQAEEKYGYHPNHGKR